MATPPDPRPREEIDLGPQHRPRRIVRTLAVEQTVATAPTLQQIDQETDAAMEEAVAFAKASPLAARPEDALLDVFAP